MATKPSGKKKPKSKKPPKRGRGRPPSYKPEYAEQARKLCLLRFGTTNEELAKYFGKNVDTIYEWQKKHPEFSEALRAGKLVADTHIASRLYDRADGAVWFEEVAFKLKRTEYDENGRKTLEKEEVQVVMVRRAAPPDTAAIALWLHNRDPNSWRKNPEPTDDDAVVSPVRVEIMVKDARKVSDAKPIT